MYKIIRDTKHAKGPHYENTPIQIYWKFYHQKNEKKNQIKKFRYFFHFSAQTQIVGIR